MRYVQWWNWGLITPNTTHNLFLNYCGAQIFHHPTALCTVCQLSASASSFELLPSLHLSQGQFQWLILSLGQGQNCRNMLYDLLRVCCLIFLPLFFKPSEKLLQMISDDSVFLFPPLTSKEVAHSSLLIPSDVQLAKGCNVWCLVGCLMANTHILKVCAEEIARANMQKRYTITLLGVIVL